MKSLSLILGIILINWSFADECKDIEPNCDFQKCIEEGYRNKCQKTCGVCKCKDYRDDCGSTLSDCFKESVYTQCQHTCGLCGDFCGNKLTYKKCETFQSKGHCSKEYVKSVCQRTCGKCGNICKDYTSKTLCAGYKGTDHCKNYDYTRNVCRETCGICSNKEF